LSIKIPLDQTRDRTRAAVMESQRLTLSLNLCMMSERMHGGAPAHFSRAVQYVLNNAYHDQWIGRGGPTAWPRSPD
jgi:hypothetical protein